MKSEAQRDREAKEASKNYVKQLHDELEREKEASDDMKHNERAFSDQAIRTLAEAEGAFKAMAYKFTEEARETAAKGSDPADTETLGRALFCLVERVNALEKTVSKTYAAPVHEVRTAQEHLRTLSLQVLEIATQKDTIYERQLKDLQQSMSELLNRVNNAMQPSWTLRKLEEEVKGLKALMKISQRQTADIHKLKGEMEQLRVEKKELAKAVALLTTDYQIKEIYYLTRIQPCPECKGAGVPTLGGKISCSLKGCDRGWFRA